MSGGEMGSGRRGSERPAVVPLERQDDRASLRYRLDAVSDGRVALLLPWDIPFLSRELDFDLLRREARRRHLEVAIVSPDPERRALARGCGFPAFPSVEEACAAGRWNGHAPREVAPPPQHWWEQPVDLQRKRTGTRPAWLGWIRQSVRGVAFVAAIVVLAASAYAIVPRAEVTLVPSGTTLSVTVPVSVDPALDAEEEAGVGTGSVVPARRVGMEVEGTAEVGTSGTASVTAGRATGQVLFTALLSQDYVVPSGTIVRTSSTSYPIRFRTTADVVVPADGQATAPIEALDERTGNVGALQINRVEGVAGSAVRVINPEPTTGAEPKEVAVVSQADYDRVRERLTQELLNEAHYELHGLLEENEFLPRQSLRVESVPKKSYSHFIGEEADTLSLNMRLLVSGQAVDGGDVQAVAYQALVQKLPPGHQLIDAEFELGSVTEEEEGPAWFSVSATAQGYAAARVNVDEAVELIRGRPVAEAREALTAELPLAEPPQFALWPEWPDQLNWLERVPFLTLRIDVNVTPKSSLTADES
ncbi:MAG: hypothetical protein R6X31_13095 [Anaerolineae bacterium]